MSTYSFTQRDLQKNGWNHLALTWNRANKVFNAYLNADLKVTKESKEANVDLRETRLPTIEFGRSDGGRFLDGLLSDVVILPYAMNQLSIQSLKGMHLQTMYTKLWKLHERPNATRVCNVDYF